MKSKQLANVLIKMLGLSICVYAIPGFVSGLYMAFQSPAVTTKTETVLLAFGSAIGVGVQAIVGIVIISASRKISGWMFKSEED